MKAVERYLHPPPHPNEVGERLLPQTIARYFAYDFPKTHWTLVPQVLPTLTDHLPDMFLTPQIRDLRVKLREATSKIPQPAGELIRDNLIFTRSEGGLRPGLTYPDNWLRDQFLTCMALNDPEVESYLLNKFLDAQKKDGQLPTTRLFASNRAWYFNDESTMLGIIWRAKLVKMGVDLSKEEREKWRKALGWVERHSKGGFYTTPEGSERSWFDTFIFEKEDVLSYNQGIYAACLLAAEILGIKPKTTKFSEAKEAYHQVKHPSGRLKLSMNYPYKDTSSVVGDFISRRIFNEFILDHEIAIETVSSLYYENGGYRVVTEEDDDLLDPRHFNNSYKRGEYQVSAQWPAYSAIAEDTYEAHGYSYDPTFWNDHVNVLDETHKAEWIKTGVPQFAPRCSRGDWFSNSFRVCKRGSSCCFG